ncbi:MAG: glycosyltransferase family protein, partial [Gammaproteobacteria bacterium]
ILSGSPLLNAFRIPPGIDYVKLPCLARSVAGEYGTKYLRMDYAQLLRMRANLIVNAALDFAPDLVLVDKKPLGIDSELEACLRLLQRRLDPHIVLLLRDILDAPKATVPVWRKHRYHELLAEFYSKILVVGDPRVFDVVSQYRFPPASAALTEYCGYVARDVRPESPTRLRRELGLPEQPTVLVAAGGGEDGFDLLATYLRGLRESRTQAARSSVLFCGPEMPPAQRTQLRAMAAGLPGIHLHDFTDDMMTHVGAADLVVSMGGYNTVCECLSARRRMLIVPRIAPVREQQLRADALAAQGLASTIHPRDLTPAALMSRVDTLLGASAPLPRAASVINMQGLEGVRAAITALLQPALPNRSARPVSAGVA